jgi:hypothetical protein
LTNAELDAIADALTVLPGVPIERFYGG